MQIISLLWGIAAIGGMIVAFIPFFGVLNWLLIPFAGLGLIISAISIAITSKDRGTGTAGLLMCVVALLLGTLRLILGGGVF